MTAAPRGTLRTASSRYPEDLPKDPQGITVPVMVMHGDDDQIVPLRRTPGPLSAELVQNGTLKTYKGFPHGRPRIRPRPRRSSDLLEFVRS